MFQVAQIYHNKVYFLLAGIGLLMFNNVLFELDTTEQVLNI